MPDDLKTYFKNEGTHGIKVLFAIFKGFVVGVAVYFLGLLLSFIIEKCGGNDGSQMLEQWDGYLGVFTFAGVVLRDLIGLLLE